MIDRRLFIHFDWALLGMVLLIASIGILNLYSVTSGEETLGTPLYLKQILWLALGLGAML
ncbi:MAG: rod shape-determining protein RodA, partial [Deltaproteobacteria bacterium]|nr:rod shape-determining protein RodA [Deltaproteobacteria bacterium]